MITHPTSRWSRAARGCSARRQRRAVSFVAGLLLLAWLGPVAGPTRAAVDEEYRVEAAFIFNFCKFVTWPEAAFTDPTSALTIGILGENPFGDALGSVQGTAVKGRTIAVKEVKSAEAAAGCQVLFISRSHHARASEILGKLAGRPVLTVSECPGFARMGGIIEFVTVGDNVRFKVNLGVARQRALTLSSQLLGVAVEVLKS